ncbi:MAG TPA: phosphoribosylamine--glycine ligase [Candidatus Hydrogenedentes bacterium]|nr:phosphoribosylamine--glycine ligase [Candidatus Hydrogenedentota bacterium]
MNALVIGGGGREHALAWKIAQSPLIEKVFCAPGNPGIDRLEKGESIALSVDDFEIQAEFIAARDVGLTVVGPEAPLAAGVVDYLSERGRTVFGPSAAAARLEGSKAFAKAFMARHDIPTAAYAEFVEPEAAMAFVQEKGAPIVVKADGLAAGKGVSVCADVDAALTAIRAMMVDRVFGDAGAKIVIEECLVGEEASILAFCDGRTTMPMASSQDHKRVNDGDQGPNTGGMGAYSPAPVVTAAVMREIEERILRPVVAGMAREDTPYTGILYAGLMITEQGPKVIEFNVRFGDPETQVVLPRMRGDIVPLLLACCNGALEGHEIDYEDNACVTVVMASGGYPGPYEKGKEIAGIDAAEADSDVIVFHAGTRQEGDRLLTSGGRVLNVTACDPDIRSAIDKAYGAVRKITFDDAHYRTDIGRRALARLDV